MPRYYWPLSLSGPVAKWTNDSLETIGGRYCWKAYLIVSLYHISLDIKPATCSNGRTMQLYDPERPTLGNGMLALLNGDAIPRVYVMPLANEAFELMAMVRSDLGPGHSWRACILDDKYQLANFFSSYRENPEDTLLTYFGSRIEDEPQLVRDPNTVSGLDFL